MSDPAPTPCRKCGAVTPYDQDHRQRRGKYASGWSPQCKKCDQAMGRAAKADLNARRRRARSAAPAEATAPAPEPVIPIEVDLPPEWESGQIRTNPATPTLAPAPAPAPTPADDDSDRPRVSLILPDLHIPDHHRPLFANVLRLMEELRPDEVILLGDATDQVACSWYGGPNALRAGTYKEEAERGRVVLEEVTRRCPKVILTEGNHDLRAQAVAESKAPQLDGAVQDLLYAPLGVRVITEKEDPLQRGTALLLHGHQDLGRKFPPIYHARRMIERYNRGPGSMVIYGHTHKPQLHSLAMHGGCATGHGLGCMQVRPAWARGVSGWELEFAVLHVGESGTTLERVFPLPDGSFWWGGRRFG